MFSAGMLALAMRIPAALVGARAEQTPVGANTETALRLDSFASVRPPSGLITKPLTRQRSSTLMFLFWG